MWNQIGQLSISAYLPWLLSVNREWLLISDLSIYLPGSYREDILSHCLLHHIIVLALYYWIIISLSGSVWRATATCLCLSHLRCNSLITLWRHTVSSINMTILHAVIIVQCFFCQRCSGNLPTADTVIFSQHDNINKSCHAQDYDVLAYSVLAKDCRAHIPQSEHKKLTSFCGE